MQADQPVSQTALAPIKINTETTRLATKTGQVFQIKHLLPSIVNEAEAEPFVVQYIMPFVHQKSGDLVWWIFSTIASDAKTPDGRLLSDVLPPDKHVVMTTIKDVDVLRNDDFMSVEAMRAQLDEYVELMNAPDEPIEVEGAQAPQTT